MSASPGSRPGVLWGCRGRARPSPLMAYESGVCEGWPISDATALLRFSRMDAALDAPQGGFRTQTPAPVRSCTMTARSAFPHFAGFRSSDQRQRGRGVHRGHRRPAISERIAGHDEVTPRGFGGGRADRVFEVRPAHGERAAQHDTIDGSDFRNHQQICDQATRERAPPLPRRQVVNGRHAMRRQQDRGPAAIGQTPELRRRCRERRPTENEIENDVDVEQEPLQRYLRAR